VTGARVLVAPDKFKGSLTARQVADAVARGLTTGDPSLRVATLPVADGGDGTVAAALAAGATAHPVRVTGPTGEPVDAEVALLGGTAIVELAQASGLALLPGGVLAPLTAQSTGTGELIRAALDLGPEAIVVGVGGSAATDGGTGMLTALGACFLDADGRPVGAGGGALGGIASVDLSGLDPRLSSVPITLASDVTNPLLGPTGAAAVYGPQKGADAAQIAALDAGLAHLVDVVEAALGMRDTARAPGAGAAGGVGWAALTLLGATFRPGIDLVLDLVGADRAFAGVDLVITGEGRLDDQTLDGKAPAGVLRTAAAHGVPVLAVAGSCALSPAEASGAGLIDVRCLSELEPDPATSIARAGSLLEHLATDLARQHAATGRWQR